MPEQDRELNQLTARLAQLAGESDASAQIAGLVVSAWRQIEAALTPIVGRRAVAMLYKRGLYVTCAAFPWLTCTHEGLQDSADPDTLGAELARQTGSVAAAGGSAFLQSFRELLASLVGPSLTGQLLGPVWALSLNGVTVKDPPA